MNAFVFLIDAVGGLYITVILLRVWLQWAQADFYNQLSQFVVKVTQPVVGPLRRYLPAIGPIDTAAVIFAYLVAVVVVALTVFLQYQTISLVPILIDALYELLSKTFWLVFIVLIASAIMSWISQGRHPIELLFNQLTSPLLRPIRKVIPPVGGLDLSVLVLILGLQFLRHLINGVLGPVI